MKVETHLLKVKRFEHTLGKLDLEEDYETVIEAYMLVSAHLINAAMHHLGAIRVDKDIRHNKLASFLKTEGALKEGSEQVAELIQQLEQLRPSHVYGKGENGSTARKARECYIEIKRACEELMGE